MALLMAQKIYVEINFTLSYQIFVYCDTQDTTDNELSLAHKGSTHHEEIYFIFAHISHQKKNVY